MSTLRDHRKCLSRADVALLIRVLAVIFAIFFCKVIFCYIVPDVLSGYSGLAIDISTIILSLIFIGGAIIGNYYQNDLRIILAILTPALCLLGGTAGLRTQFIVFHVGRKFRLIDEDLAAWDSAMGFEWRSYLEWIMAHPCVNWVLIHAYQSIWCQPLILSGLFIWTKRVREYSRLQVAFPLSFVSVCLVATFLPALGAYQFHDMTPDRHLDMPLAFTNGATAPITWLRQAELPSILPDFPDLRVVTFPSWHAAAAVVFVLSAWALPRFRWLGLFLNLLLLAATPVHGSHFLADVVIGAALGGVSFALAAWALMPAPLAWFGTRPRRRSFAIGAHGSGFRTGT